MAKQEFKDYQPSVYSQPNGRRSVVCQESACENLAIAAGYCRPHYIKNWKKIKHKQEILKDDRLRQYIRELVSKYSVKYIDALIHDLADDNAFARAITELNLDESAHEFNQIDTLDDIKTDIEDTD